RRGGRRGGGRTGRGTDRAGGRARRPGVADLPRRLLAGRRRYPRRRTAPKRAAGGTDRAVDLRAGRAPGRGGARRWRQRAAGVHGPRHTGSGGALPRRRTEPGAAARTRLHRRLARLPDAALGVPGGDPRPGRLAVAKTGRCVTRDGALVGAAEAAGYWQGQKAGRGMRGTGNERLSWLLATPRSVVEERGHPCRTGIPLTPFIPRIPGPRQGSSRLKPLLQDPRGFG